MGMFDNIMCRVVVRRKRRRARHRGACASQTATAPPQKSGSVCRTRRVQGNGACVCVRACSPGVYVTVVARIVQRHHHHQSPSLRGVPRAHVCVCVRNKKRKMRRAKVFSAVKVQQQRSGSSAFQQQQQRVCAFCCCFSKFFFLFSRFAFLFTAAAQASPNHAIMEFIKYVFPKILE